MKALSMLASVYQALHFVNFEITTKILDSKYLYYCFYTKIYQGMLILYIYAFVIIIRCLNVNVFDPRHAYYWMT